MYEDSPNNLFFLCAKTKFKYNLLLTTFGIACMELSNEIFQAKSTPISKWKEQNNAKLYMALQY